MNNKKESSDIGPGEGNFNKSAIAPGNIITGPLTLSPSTLKEGADTRDSDVGFPLIPSGSSHQPITNASEGKKSSQARGKNLTINTSLPPYSTNPNFSVPTSSNTTYAMGGQSSFCNQWQGQNASQGSCHYPVNSQTQNPVQEEEQKQQQADNKSPSYHQDDQNTVTTQATHPMNNNSTENCKTNQDGNINASNFSNPPITPNHYGNNSNKQSTNTPYRNTYPNPPLGSSHHPPPPYPPGPSYSYPQHQTPKSLYHNPTQSGSNSNMVNLKNRAPSNHMINKTGPANMNMNVNPGVYHTPNLYGSHHLNSHPNPHSFPPQPGLMYPPHHYPNTGPYSVSPTNTTITSPPPHYQQNAINASNLSSQQMTSATILVKNNPHIKKKMDRLSKKLETVVGKILKEHFDGYDDKKELCRALHVYQNQINSTLSNTVLSKLKEMDKTTGSVPIYQNGLYFGQQGDPYLADNSRVTLDLVNPQNSGPSNKKRRFPEDSSSTSNSAQSLEPAKKKRKGQWTPAEVVYADKLIEYFQKGIVGLVLSGEVDETTNLRGFLSERLRCDPMRVSKRYQRSLQYDGWLEYRTCVHRREERDKISDEELRTIRKEMARLENNFLEKIGEPLVNYNYESNNVDSGLESSSSSIANLKPSFTSNTGTTTNTSVSSTLHSPKNYDIVENDNNSNSNSNNTSPSSSKIVIKDDTEEEISTVANADHDLEEEREERKFNFLKRTTTTDKSEGKSPLTEHQNIPIETSPSIHKDISKMQMQSKVSNVERKEKPDMDMEIDISPYTLTNGLLSTTPTTSTGLHKDTNESQNVNKMAFENTHSLKKSEAKEWHSEEAKTPTPSYKPYEIKVVKPSN